MIGQRSNFFLLAAAGLAASQGLSSLGLSASCQSALNTAIGNPDVSKCLNVFEAINIFSTPANSSIVPPVNNWLEGLCAAAPCSNSTISQAAQNITAGCQSDLSAAGISLQQAQSIANSVEQFYPTLRKIVCLQDNSVSNHSLCVTEVLNDIQSAIGPLSTNNLVSIVQGISAGNETDVVPKSAICNDCTQAAWAILKQDDPSVTSDSLVTNAVSNQCGTDFLNGSQPTDIVESSGSASPSPGAALGSLISYEKFVAVAAVPLVGIFAGAATLF